MINRYDDFFVNGTYENIPFISISKRATDRYIEYRQGITRFDKLALQYYNNPLLDVLIKQANPMYSLEFDIEDGEIIRIPFPAEEALREYQAKLNDYFNT